jgi:hypothetical protein
VCGKSRKAVHAAVPRAVELRVRAHPAAGVVRAGRGLPGNGNGNGNHKHQQPKCTNECLIAKRNARLADALGITQEGRERREREAMVWPDDVLAFGRANAKFVGVHPFGVHAR